MALLPQGPDHLPRPVEGDRRLPRPGPAFQEGRAVRVRRPRDVSLLFRMELEQERDELSLRVAEQVVHPARCHIGGFRVDQSERLLEHVAVNRQQMMVRDPGTAEQRLLRVNLR